MRSSKESGESRTATSSLAREHVTSIVILATLLMSAAAILTLHDVTKSKASQDRPKGDGGLVMLSTQGRVVCWSKEAQELTGYTEADVSGKELMDLLPMDGRDEARAKLRQAAKHDSKVVLVLPSKHGNRTLRLSLSLRGLADCWWGLVKEQ